MKFQPVRASRTKGQTWKNLGMWNESQFEKIVNLQNAEVTKMLDNKSEQKWPLAAKKRTDHKVRQSRVISFAGRRAASQCVTNPGGGRYAIGCARYRSLCVILSEAARCAAQSKDLPCLVIAVIASGLRLTFFVPLLRLAFSLRAW